MHYYNAHYIPNHLQNASDFVKLRIMKKTLPENNRSVCPVSCFLDILGDKWSVLIVRDMMFTGKKTYKEFLNSPEGIATNILSSRLVALEKNGFIQKEQDPNNKKVPIYTLTRKGKDLMPILVEVYLWAEKYFPIPPDILVQIQQFKEAQKHQK